MNTVDDDISMTNSSSRVTPMENDDADSDDLQFVDDLNMEPLEQQSSTTISNQSVVSYTATHSQSAPLSTDASVSNTTIQLSTNSPKNTVADKPVSADSKLESLTLSPSSGRVAEQTLPLGLSTFGQDNTESSGTIPGAVESLKQQSLADTNPSAPEIQPTDNDPESSQSSQSDKVVGSSQAADETKAEPEAPIANIIKHFIEGFTIEESTEPFPVHRSSLLTELQQRTKKKRTIGRRRTIAGSAIAQLPLGDGSARPASASKARQSQHAVVKSEVKRAVDRSYSDLSALASPELTEAVPGGEEMCATCRARCVNLCFYRGEPFCSRPCVKKRKSVIFANPETAPPKRGRPVGAMTRNKPTYRNSGKVAKVTFSRYRPKSSLSDSSERRAHGMGSDYNYMSPDRSMSFTPEYYISSFPAENGYGSDDSALAGSEIISDSLYKRSDVLHWTVSDVREFIQSLSGCERYSCDFEQQEIDGRALLLLNEDHLLNALDIKLGPAIKIYQQVMSFR